jgi:enoyl-CoA hydratase
MNVLDITSRDGVAVVTLNRPEAHNALSAELRSALSEGFARLAADPEVRVIVLTGAGERAFCAGLDLKELAANASVLSFAEGEFNPASDIAQCPKPVIGAINGVAVTGGFELALACDVLIASANAKFADTHARVGVLPSWGLSQLLSRVVGPYRARQLSFTGSFLDAPTALAWGLVGEVVAADQLMNRAISLAAEIASVEPDMMRQYKRLINSGLNLPLADALAMEVVCAREHNQTLTPEAIGDKVGGVFDRGRSAHDNVPGCLAAHDVDGHFHPGFFRFLDGGSDVTLAVV